MQARELVQEQAEMYVLQNVGHLATVGSARYAPSTRRWRVPVLVPVAGRSVHVGDVELNDDLVVVKGVRKSEVLVRVASGAAVVAQESKEPVVADARLR